MKTFEECIAPLKMFRLIKDKESLYLITLWWFDLYNTEDAQYLLGERRPSIESLFYTFASPSNTYCLINKKEEVVFLAWFRPVDGTANKCACLSFWANKEYRVSKTCVHFLSKIHELAFKEYSTVIGLTTQSKIVKTGKKWLNYTTVGKVPHIFNGLEGYIRYGTKDSFYKSLCYKKARELKGV